MRSVHLADVESAARALLPYAPDQRAAVMRQMIADADVADLFRQTHRRPHARYGTGTLMSCAAGRHIAPRPPALCADALHAYGVVINALLSHATHQSS